MCHAVNLFFEARGEPPPGQRMVLDVVVNRRNSPDFPDSVCGVVTQRNAFSWYNDHKKYLPEDPIEWEDYIYKLYGMSEPEMDAWEGIFLISFNHYIHRESDFTNGATYFMTVAKYVEREQQPFPGTAPAIVVGDHIFFKECKEDMQCLRF